MCSVPDLVGQRLLGDIVEEFALDLERPTGERHLDLALAPDVLDAILEQMRDMGGIGGRGNGDDRLCVGDLPGSGEDRRPAKTVPDQDRRRLTRLPQMVGGEDEIGDVRRERRIGEIAFAGAEPGEVEPQHGNAARRQRRRDAPRRQHVLAAGEAMRKQRVGLDGAVGQIERGGELLPLGARELEAFGRHGGSSLVMSGGCSSS